MHRHWVKKCIVHVIIRGESANVQSINQIRWKIAKKFDRAVGRLMYRETDSFGSVDTSRNYRGPAYDCGFPREPWVDTRLVMIVRCCPIDNPSPPPNGSPTVHSAHDAVMTESTYTCRLPHRTVPLRDAAYMFYLTPCTSGTSSCSSGSAVAAIMYSLKCSSFLAGRKKVCHDLVQVGSAPSCQKLSCLPFLVQRPMSIQFEYPRRLAYCTILRY